MRHPWQYTEHNQLKPQRGVGTITAQFDLIRVESQCVSLQHASGHHTQGKVSTTIIVTYLLLGEKNEAGNVKHKHIHSLTRIKALSSAYLLIEGDSTSLSLCIPDHFCGQVALFGIQVVVTDRPPLTVGTHQVLLVAHGLAEADVVEAVHVVNLPPAAH